jgi:hypothetical protein
MIYQKIPPLQRPPLYKDRVFSAAGAVFVEGDHCSLTLNNRKVFLNTERLIATRIPYYKYVQNTLILYFLTETHKVKVFRHALSHDVFLLQECTLYM